MATCGNYELDRAIGWGRHGTFFAARAGGGGGDFLLVIRRARSVERGVSQPFLRSAAEQQAAVAAGCRRLAPILGFEVDHSGFAFYATTRFETSLAEFLEASCKVDSGLLREIVTGVLGALVELHEKSRRAHGNVTPGNVLLDSRERILLTDLAPAGKDATTADDLFALGTLIYQLVRRTARVGFLNPPLGYSPEWTDSLGDEAEAWREFTNRLLSRTRYAEPAALEAAASDLKSIEKLETTVAPATAVESEQADHGATRKPPPKRRVGAKVAAALLILAGGGGGFWYAQHVKKLKQDAENARIADERRRAFDDALGARLKPFREAINSTPPPELAADKDLLYIFTRLKPDLEVQQTGGQISAEGIQSQVQLKLDGWPVREKLKALAAAWREPPRQWKRFADEIEEASWIIVAVRGDDDRPIIDELVTAARTLTQAGKIEDGWNQIISSLDALKKIRSQNPLLPDFTEWAAGELGRAARLADVPNRGLSVLDTLKAVRKFCDDDWKRVLAVRFEKEAGDVIKKPGPERIGTWPRDWVRRARGFLRPEDGKLAAWDETIKRAAARIPKRPPAERPGWTQKLDAFRDRTATALEGDVDEIDGLGDEFKKLRTPIEDAHEQYVAFVVPWKTKAAGAADKKQAEAMLKEFTSFTDKLPAEFSAGIDAKKLAGDLKARLDTPDKISLEFEGAAKADWTLLSSDPGLAIYRYKDAVDVPFLALSKTGPAMAAIETPLSLAKLSGSPVATLPGGGPQIRTGTLDVAPDWIWRGLNEFVTGPTAQSLGVSSALSQGVRAGDTDNDTCPVTWLSFTDAEQMAKQLGGTLPTAADWGAANSNRAGPVRRLRAGAWTAQSTHIGRAQGIPGHPGRMPDAGSFSKEIGLLGADLGYIKDAGPVAGAANDGFLWLRSAYPNGKDAAGYSWNNFSHLIGNAAEWIGPRDRPAIAGGSVVSPRALPTDRPLTAPSKDRGYFDVTFRLVVKMGKGGAGVGLDLFKEAATAIAVPEAPAIQ